MDLSKLTLGQLLTSEDTTIYRNAQSILKVLRKCDHSYDETRRCIYCFKLDARALDKGWSCAQCGFEGTQAEVEDHECPNARQADIT